jgi:PAS domain S-box-containing protein
MSDYSNILISALIFLGSGIMLVNIIRFHKTVSVLMQSDLPQGTPLRGLILFHQGLMVFFLLGYLAVALAIVAEIAFLSEFFIGFIFLGGSIFVWLGILLQHRLIAMIQIRYEQARQATDKLEREHAKLEAANVRLNSEVSERRRAEAALRESEQRFKFILDQLPTGILIIDEATKSIKDANSAALKIIGRPLNEVVGAECHGYICPADKGQCPIIDLHQQIDRSRRMLIKKEGHEVPIWKTVCRIRLDGKPHLLESFVDISDKERLEAQLQRAQKMEALGELAGGVAHDLNNILTGIVSYPELLLRKIPKKSPLRKPIKTIKQTGEKAATIVQDLLTLARRGVMVKEVVSFGQVVRDYFNSPEHSQLTTHHPDVTFSYRVGDDLLNIMGSEFHLLKALMNLVSNAAESMPDGGTVLIDVDNRYVDRPVKGYDTVEEGDYVVLAVIDSGTGIAPEDRDRIFEPFYTKKKLGRSGTGLGMAVVWGTVKDHHGYISVDSEPARGTTITLFYPATRKRLVDSGDTERLLDSSFGHGESILIVDDVKVQRKIAMEMLTELNYRPYAVASGEEAVVYLRDHQAELVLLDMIMDPGMGGLETYRKILKLNPRQRAILVSGYSETEDVRLAICMGAGRYVKKPYSLKTIGLAIQEELSK